MIAVSLSASANTVGVQLDRTRVFMSNGESRAKYAVSNHTETPVLASATVTNADGTATSKLTVSPALYQIRANTTHQGSIILLEPLAQDTESVFWLNVKTVAPESDASKTGSSLQFAIGQRIKIFYRPKGIKEDCKIVADKLKWTKTKDGLKVENDTPLSMSLVEVTVGTKKFRLEDLLLPKSSKDWQLAIPTNHKMSFTYVDEYGNYVEHPLVIN